MWNCACKFQRNFLWDCHPVAIIQFAAAGCQALLCRECKAGPQLHWDDHGGRGTNSHGTSFMFLKSSDCFSTDCWPFPKQNVCAGVYEATWEMHGSLAWLASLLASVPELRNLHVQFMSMTLQKTMVSSIHYPVILLSQAIYPGLGWCHVKWRWVGTWKNFCKVD